MQYKNTLCSTHLDFIRGFAAIMVLITHLKGLFLPYKALHSPSLLVKIIYFFTGLGSEAVMVFFVLSGLLVGGGVIHSMQNHKFIWKIYLIKRLTRLYVVLIPALCIGYLVITAGHTVALTLDPIYTSFTVFCKNVLFLQTIHGPSFARNLPLWSLCNEFWYYLLFPMLIYPLFTKCKFNFFIAFCSLSVIWLIGFDKSILFLVWCFGAMLYIIKPSSYMYSSGKLRYTLIFITILLMAIEFFLSKLHVLSQLSSDIIIGLFFSMFLYCMMHTKNPKITSTIYYKLSTVIASCSYTLYLIHYPIILVVQQIIKNYHLSTEPNILNTLFALSIGLSIWLISFLIAKGTEAHTDKIRNFILNSRCTPGKGEAEGVYTHYK